MHFEEKKIYIAYYNLYKRIKILGELSISEK